MKLISVSSLLYYVSDITKSKEFYEAVGFRFDRDNNRVVTYLNWFSIELREAEKPINSNSGEFVYIKVDSVDEMQARLESKGFKPDDDPQEVNKGVKELQVRDPDGYRFTFFEKK